MTPTYQRKYSIWNEGTGNRPYGEGRDQKEFRTDFERSGYKIIDTGHFHIDYDRQNMGVLSDGFAYMRSKLTPSVFDNIKEDLANPIWSILITQYLENHSEGYQVYNTFADTNLVFTTGAMPIAVTISGFLPANLSYNAKIDFLAFYRFFLRGTQTRIYEPAKNKHHKIPVGFTMGTTSMKLNITSVKLDTTVEIPDFDFVTVEGVGYNYSNVPKYSYNY